MTAGSIGLYIHWPFCVHKCPYCDFNSYVHTPITTSINWDELYKQQVQDMLECIDKKTIETIFFGGGTPSLMPLKLLEDILNMVGNNHQPKEISLEVNPTTASKQLIKDLQSVGINRLSIGAQSFNNKDLQFLERTHSVEETQETLAHTAAIFKNWSMDIIYALPTQKEEAWEQELEKLLQYKPPHVSLYQLTIEENTVFHKKKIQPAKTERALRLWEITHKALNNVGLPWYEVSNHAKTNHQCQHNKIYWQGGEYWGIGAGAHGRITSNGTWYAQENKKNPLQWAKAVQQRESPYTMESIDKEERFQEMILMGLRLKEGLPPHLMNALPKNKCETLCNEGYIYITEGGYLAITDKGLRTLNSVISHLLL